MKYWRIEVLNNGKQESHSIEAVGYPKKLIKKIFKETHPEWDIKKIVPIEAIPQKTRER